MVTLEQIVNEVRASGLRCETPMGSKHIKIVVEGELCGIWKQNSKTSDGRSPLNVLSQVRRCIRKHRGEA